MSRISTYVPKRPTILRAFGTLIALALLIYLLRQQGWDEIRAAIQQIPLWRFALALGLIGISRLAVSARWHVLLHSSGIKTSFWQSARITFAGLFASNFLPTTIGGDVIRLAGAVQLEIDAALCAASLIVDRLVGMTGMAMVLPFGLPALMSARTLSNFAPILVTIPATSQIRRWGRKAWDKTLEISSRVLGALAIWLKKPRSLAMSLFFSWIHILCLFSTLTLLLRGMGESIPFWLIGGLYSFTYFVTLLPISINGYGLQEISITVIFSSLGGVSLENSLTSALLFRTLVMLASLPGVVFVPGLLSAKNRTQNGEQPSLPAEGSSTSIAYKDRI